MNVPDNVNGGQKAVHIAYSGIQIQLVLTVF